MKSIEPGRVRESRSRGRSAPRRDLEV